MPEQDVLRVDLIVQTLRRRKWLFLAVVATVFAASFLQAFTQTPLYRATAIVQIAPEDSKVLPFEEMAESSGGVGYFSSYLLTQAQKIRSDDLAESVITHLALHENESFTAKIRKGVFLETWRALSATVARVYRGTGRSSDQRVPQPRDYIGVLLGHLRVEPIRDTQLLRVSFDSPDPELAAAVANSVPGRFIERHLESRFEATTQASEFLREQLRDLKFEVERSEEVLLEYAKQKNIVNLSERETAARKSLASLSDQLTTVQSDLIRKRADFQTVTETMTGFPEALADGALARLEEQRFQLEQELSGLAERHGPEFHRVKEIQLQLADLESQLARQRQRILVRIRQEYELAQTRFDQLATAVNDQRVLVDRLNEDSIQYKILDREAASTKELYNGLLQRLKEANVEAGLRSTNIQVTDAADPPQSPTSPRKGRYLLFGLGFGIMLGFGTVLGAEAIDNTLKTPDDVTAELGLPALGAIPFLLAGGIVPMALNRRGRKSAGPILEEAVAADQKIAAREAYRSVRTSLLLSHSNRPPQVILVTSALPAEGKTTTVANLAISFAATGEPTLMIDADLRRPALGDAFAATAKEGLTQFLSGTSGGLPHIELLDRPELSLMVAGPIPPNPPELLGSARMREALEIVRDSFTYILIDSPPALGLADVRVLAQQVDGIVLVTRAGKTPRAAVSQAAREFTQVGGRLLGVIVNETPASLVTHYGYGSYGELYGSGPLADRHDGRDSARSEWPS